MENNTFDFCPDCGSRNIKLSGGRKWNCPDCGFELYNNVAAACGVLLFNGEGKLLFERRTKEPRKGCLALPGGFVDPDESVEQAIQRECREEIGVKIEDIKYLCSNPNNYLYKNILYKTCDIFFTARLPEGVEFNIDPGEVQSLEWHAVTSAEDVEKLPIAFESTRQTLLKWVAGMGGIAGAEVVLS